MKILGFDTATKFLCIGLYDGLKVYAYNLEADRRHSCFLVPHIKRILDLMHYKIKDIDYIACGIGPGSFTGIRIAISTAKGIGWSLNKPLIAVSTLDIIAQNASDRRGTRFIVTVDAKRNLIYTAFYKNKNGLLRRTSSYTLVTEEQLLKIIPKGSIILGDALGLYSETIRSNKKDVILLDKDYWYPCAENIIRIALEKIRKNDLVDHFNLEPIYLYPNECQIRKT